MYKQHHGICRTLPILITPFSHAGRSERRRGGCSSLASPANLPSRRSERRRGGCSSLASLVNLPSRRTKRCHQDWQSSRNGTVITLTPTNPENRLLARSSRPVDPLYPVDDVIYQSKPLARTTPLSPPTLPLALTSPPPSNRLCWIQWMVSINPTDPTSMQSRPASLPQCPLSRTLFSQPMKDQKRSQRGGIPVGQTPRRGSLERLSTVHLRTGSRRGNLPALGYHQAFCPFSVITRRFASSPQNGSGREIFIPRLLLYHHSRPTEECNELLQNSKEFLR
jgi:hypothetical protein